MSNSRNVTTSNLGTQTLANQNGVIGSGIWYAPVTPGQTSGAYGSVAPAPGYGISGSEVSFQTNITGPLPATIAVYGSVDGVHFSNTFGSNLGTAITAATRTLKSAADGVVATLIKVPTFTGLATTAVSSTVGQLTFLQSALNGAGMGGVVPGVDQVQVLTGNDTATYLLTGLSSVVTKPGGTGFAMPSGVSATYSPPVIQWTATLATPAPLRGSTAPTAQILNGSQALFTSATANFSGNGAVIGDGIQITSATNKGSYLIASGITATTAVITVPSGLLTAASSESYNVLSSSPYPNSYIINTDLLGYPFYQVQLVPSGIVPVGAGVMTTLISVK